MSFSRARKNFLELERMALDVFAISVLIDNRRKEHRSTREHLVALDTKLQEIAQYYPDQGMWVIQRINRLREGNNHGKQERR